MVSRSSSEDEYKALSHTTFEGHWLMHLLQDFHIANSSPIIIIYCDNKYVLHIAVNHVFHKRNKHIEIDCHVARDKVLRQSTARSYTFTLCSIKRTSDRYSNKTSLSMSI